MARWQAGARIRGARTPRGNECQAARGVEVRRDVANADAVVVRERSQLGDEAVGAGAAAVECRQAMQALATHLEPGCQRDAAAEGEGRDHRRATCVLHLPRQPLGGGGVLWRARAVMREGVPLRQQACGARGHRGAVVAWRFVWAIVRPVVQEGHVVAPLSGRQARPCRAEERGRPERHGRGDERAPRRAMRARSVLHDAGRARAVCAGGERAIAHGRACSLGPATIPRPAGSGQAEPCAGVMRRPRRGYPPRRRPARNGIRRCVAAHPFAGTGARRTRARLSL